MTPGTAVLVAALADYLTMGAITIAWGLEGRCIDPWRVVKMR